jgi:hypothetical protein
VGTWALIFLKDGIADGALKGLSFLIVVVGFMLFGDRRGVRGGAWSYSGEDWCGGGGDVYVYDDCNRVRGVVAALNKTAGVIIIAIGYVFDRPHFSTSVVSQKLSLDDETGNVRSIDDGRLGIERAQRC